MATATPITEERIVPVPAGIRLELTVDEAQWLLDLVGHGVTGRIEAPLRITNAAIYRALRAAGLTATRRGDRGFDGYVEVA